MDFMEARPADAGISIARSALRIDRGVRCNLSAFEAIVEDDKEYFRAASHHKIAHGWRVLLPGPLLPPSKTCLVEPASGQTECPIQVARFCLDHGFENIRFYLSGPAHAHQAWSSVFDRAEEVAMCGPVSQVHGSSIANDLTVRAARPDDDRLKVQWLEADMARPDGKAWGAQEYVAMEGAKAAEGYMTNYLLLDRETPVGCFGISLGQPNLVRIKNLLLAKEHRGRGLGGATIGFAAQQARRLSRTWIGAFALNPGPALRLYDSHGMKALGVQTEMIAPLTRLIGGRS